MQIMLFLLHLSHCRCKSYFGKALDKALKRPFLIPVWEWQLKILLGKGSQVLTLSASVIPKKLLDEGFVFDFPSVDSAMKELIN